MITKFTISNFQAFGESSEIRLAPLTLIFGPNSAGKSSIGRALRYMQQSFSPNLSMQRNRFVANDFAVNLANYKNLVHNHDTEKVVQLGLTTNHKKFNTALFSVANNQLVALELSGKFEIEAPDGDIEKRALSLRFTRITNSEESGEDNWALDADSYDAFDQLLAAEKQSALRLVNNPSEDSHDARGRLMLLGPMRGANKLSDENRLRLAQEISSAFLTQDAVNESRNVNLTNFTPRFGISEPFYARDLDTANPEPRVSYMERKLLGLIERNWVALLRVIQETLITKFEYVKPLRDIPERLHVVSNDENVMNALAQDPEVRLKISAWLSRITHGAYELDYIPINSDTNDIFGDMGALVLKDKSLDAYVSFEDAGTGLSQVLPILAWLAKATISGDSQSAIPTVLIEQPELHLHPRMQGELFDLFAEVTSSKEVKTQIIAETHSEAFLLRAQSAIREGRLKASDVSIIYVDKVSELGSQGFEIELSPDGELTTPWPDLTNFSDIRFDQSR
jgi:predicted ATPase